MSSFVGYTFDENDALVQCYHQAFHYNTGKWSDIRQTGIDGYYSRDHEDTDWMGVGSVINIGDTILLCFWENGVDRTGLKNRFSIHRVVADGSSVYNIDAQLRPKTAPTCTWNLSTTGTINNNVTSTQSSSDVYQWTWNSKTFLHDNYYYGQTIFNSVGGITHLYDWNEGNGFVASSSNIFTVTGDYTPVHKVTNQYGLFSECQKSLRIGYNQPFGNYTYNPTTQNLYDFVTIQLNGTDTDNRITNLEHYFDGIIEDTNVNFDYFYDEVLNENKIYNHFVTVYWNDGFDNVNFNINGSIELDNVAPTVNLIVTNVGNVYIFTSNADDLEERLDYVEFKIYISPEHILEETPLTNTWSLLDTKTVSVSDWNSGATFYKGGHFRITSQAFDLDGGNSSIEEEIIDVQIGDTSGVGRQVTYFDWE